MCIVFTGVIRDTDHLAYTMCRSCKCEASYRSVIKVPKICTKSLSSLEDQLIIEPYLQGKGDVRPGSSKDGKYDDISNSQTSGDSRSSDGDSHFSMVPEAHDCNDEEASKRVSDQDDHGDEFVMVIRKNNRKGKEEDNKDGSSRNKHGKRENDLDSNISTYSRRTKGKKFGSKLLGFKV